MAHAHDDHHAPVADGDDIPQHGAALAEPRSPVWLPYLGVALFGACVVWWLSTPNAAEEARANAAASASASAAAAEEAPPGEAHPAEPHGHPHPEPTLIPPPARPGLGPELKIAPTATINPNLKKK